MSDATTVERPHDSQSAPPADPGKKTQKKLLGALAFPIFMMLVMPLLYSWGLHSPSPHDMKVTVIGTSSSISQTAAALDTQADGKFRVDTVADDAAARDRVMNLETRAAWNPETGTLYVASAGNALATQAAQGFFEQVATAQDSTVSVVNLQPAGDDDRLGNTMMFVGLAAILGGFLTATVMRLAVPGLSLRVEAMILGAMSVVSATIPMFIAYSVFGAFQSGFIKAWLLLFVGTFIVGTFHLAGMRLIGTAQMIPTLVLLIMLGIPASGAAVAPEMVPGFFGALSRILPTPALMEGLKRIVYFPDASLGATVSALGLWGLIALAMLGFAALKHSDEPQTGERHERWFRHYFGDNHTATAEQMTRRRQLAGGLILPLFMLTVLPLSFIGAFHSPGPDGMKVDVIGSTSVVEQTVGQLGQVTSDKFDFGRSADAAQAIDKIEALEIRGAYDPQTATLYTASAGGVQASTVVQQYFSSVAQANGQELTVDDVAALPKSDLIGTGVLYIAIGAILAGYLTATISMTVGAGLPLRWKVGAVVGVSAIASLTQVLVSYQWLGILSGHEWLAALVLFLMAVTCGLVHIGGAMIIGDAMVMVSIALFLLLAVPASGVAIGTDMSSDFYGFLHPLLPTSQGIDLLKRVVYFPDAAVGRDLLTILIWLALGLAGIAAGLILQKKGKGPKPSQLTI